MTARPDFAELVATMARLRATGGCPWDRAQTPASLRPYLLEEAYETLDAIDSGLPARLKEELGDLLLQVVFHAEMAAEAGAFTVDDVVAGLVEKLIRRHPHVFGGAAAATPDAVVARWEAIKQAERADPHAAEPPQTSALAGLARTLPALILAQQMLVRAERAGHPAAVTDGTGRDPGRGGRSEDVTSEIERALDRVAQAPRSSPAAEEAAGDLLLAAVAAAKSLDVDAELALRAAADRYRARFMRLEKLVRARGKSLAGCTPDELASLWREAREAR